MAGQMVVLADGSPDTSPCDAASGSAVMSSTGTSTSRSSSLLRAGVDDRHVAVAADEPRDLVQRPLRRRQRDALHLAAGRDVEALQRQRQVRAALGGGDGVHLVDDHGRDGAQHLARVRRGEEQEQRLGRRDQHVGRPSHHRLPLGLRRVAGAHADRDVGQRQAEPVGGGADAGERAAQVPLDVVVERLQRRHVEQPDAALLRRRLRRQPVEADQERRQRLARAGRARTAACARPRRSPASPAPARASGRRGRRPRTRPPWRARTGP